MDWFWDTSETVPDGLGFSYYGIEHIVCLLLCTAIILIGTWIYCRLEEQGRKRFRYVVASAVVFTELFKQVPLIVTGRWLPCYLPFHLCNVNVFLILWHSLRPNKMLSNFLYGICLPAAMAALLFPGWDDLPVLNFMYIHSWSLHMLLVLYPVALFFGGDIQPRIKDAWKPLLLLAGMAIVIHFFNCVMLNFGFSVNFFFLRTVSKNNPLYFFQRIWGNHLYGFPIIVAAVFAIMYLPIEWKRTRNE